MFKFTQPVDEHESKEMLQGVKNMDD